MLKALEGMFAKNVIFFGRRDERNLTSNPRFTPKTLGCRDGKKTKKTGLRNTMQVRFPFSKRKFVENPGIDN